MKKVREYLYEKFSEEGDPIHDMGIGMNMTGIAQRIFKEDKKYPLIRSASPGNIKELVVTGAVGRGKQSNVGTFFKIQFYGDKMFMPGVTTKDGRLKIMSGNDKVKYAEKLVTSLGMRDFFSLIDYAVHDNTVVNFRIKPEFKTHFKPGHYPHP